VTTGAGATIAERLREVLARIADACAKAGRSADEVTLVCVSKTQPAAAVREAAEAGASDFGENYAQELVAKAAELAPAIRWHFIGRLQRNKAKFVAGKVALVHAVDSVDLAVELGKRAGAAGQPILLAVNIAGETTKGGVSAADASAFAAQLVGVAGVRLDGLMTMPPPDIDPTPHFVALRELRDRLAGELGRALPVLSMGMSDDYEIAIACGATHVRVGTAIFGPRS